jgi:hypothetical protein
MKIYRKEYNEKNKTILQIKRKETYQNSKNKHREYQLFKRFGVTLDDYKKMLEQQNGVCAICGKEEVVIDVRTKKVRVLCVDHDHQTGKVRGLLCSKCNQAIGLMSDDIKILLKAIKYLKKFQDRS